MEYKIRKVLLPDLPRVLEIYEDARAFMARSGNPNQWGTTNPTEKMLRDDIARGNLYAVTAGQTIHGVFAGIPGPDPDYRVIENGAWHWERPYWAIHRVASDGSGGILRAEVGYLDGKTDYLRIDTHLQNRPMQKAVEKLGFHPCGTVYVRGGRPRIAFDRLRDGEN